MLTHSPSPTAMLEWPQGRSPGSRDGKGDRFIFCARNINLSPFPVCIAFPSLAEQWLWLMRLDSTTVAGAAPELDRLPVLRTKRGQIYFSASARKIDLCPFVQITFRCAKREGGAGGKSRQAERAAVAQRKTGQLCWFTAWPQAANSLTANVPFEDRALTSRSEQELRDGLTPSRGPPSQRRSGRRN